MENPDGETNRTDEVSETIARFVDAVNCGDQAGAIGCFATDATIVEDIAPFRWQGADACARWMAAMWENAQRMELTGVTMELGPATRIAVDGDFAYALFAGTLRLMAPDGELRSDGQLTFALDAGGNGWRIGAMTWSGPSPEARGETFPDTPRKSP